MSHVPNSQRKLFMKWKNIFCEIKIAFVDPGDIVVISVSDAAKAIIDILPSPEPSLALRGLWLPWKQLLLLQSLFWGHWKCLHLEISFLLPAWHRGAGRLLLISVLLGFSWWGDEFLPSPGNTNTPCPLRLVGVYRLRIPSCWSVN